MGAARWLAALLLVLQALTRVSTAYPVAAALKLDELAQRSPVIVKATAGPSQVIEDDWFTHYDGFVARATQMRVISVIKGPDDLLQLVFEHYAPATPPSAPAMYMPQHYNLVPGRTYLVFAARTDRRHPASWRSLRRVADYQYLIRRWHQIPEPVLDRKLRAAALHYAADHPGYVPEVVFWNTARMLDLLDLRAHRP